MSKFEIIGVIIIGGVMLYGLFNFLNEERAKDGKKPIGCIASIIIIIVVIIFWYLTSL